MKEPICVLNKIRNIIQLYNGMLSLFHNFYPLFYNRVYLQSFKFHPLKKIQKNKAVYKTLDVMLVAHKNCHINVDGNQYDIYLSPEEDGFDEGLRFLVKEATKKFLDWDEDFFFDYEIIESSLRKMPVWHYNQWNTGIKCKIRIKSLPDILNLLYQVGIGARRSQGSEMLEESNER